MNFPPSFTNKSELPHALLGPQQVFHYYNKYSGSNELGSFQEKRRRDFDL